ncbi:MAG: hypothetical protein ACE5FU_08820 [Nitrospinota bacterium]
MEEFNVFFVLFYSAIILFMIGLFLAVVSPEKEGHIYRRKSWIIAGIFFSGLMVAYAVTRVKYNRKIGFIAFLFVGWVGNIYWLLHWIVSGLIIYWGWKQIPEEKKDYSLWWDKKNMAKQVK